VIALPEVYVAIALKIASAGQLWVVDFWMRINVVGLNRKLNLLKLAQQRMEKWE